jgi:hypothetical protein
VSKELVLEGSPQQASVDTIWEAFEAFQRLKAMAS